MVTRTVSQLVENSEGGRMFPNPEYQRGEVWTRSQQRKLIDSIFRGYQLPIFYLQDTSVEYSDGGRWDRLEIIDGQQRVNALRGYVKGDFRLFNVDDKDARFPTFLQDTDAYPCDWGGKDFHSLSEELQTKLLNTPLSVALIQNATKDEVRDLFVRLQSGFPLNAQEKRDSLPGEFTSFILNLGGKPQLEGNPGHEFFTDVLGMNPKTDRGNSRQLAAQIAILFLERHEKDPTHFSDIRSQEIDNYYYTQLNFDATSADCKQLRSILDQLASTFKDWGKPRLVAHNAIHLVLFVDSLMGHYKKSWEGSLLNAQVEFSKLQSQANQAYKDGEENETWLRYNVRTRYGADRAENIASRHQYYSARMVDFLGDALVPLDPKRTFNSVEREYIYWRDGGECQVCHFNVKWPSEVEIHHVIEHQDGGQTVVENGVLVHDYDHPKGRAAIEFAAKYLAEKSGKQ